MKKFLSNFGQEIEAESITLAVEKLSEAYVELAADRINCPLKIHDMKPFSTKRMKGTGVRLIAVPDLPEFVSGLIRHLPEIDISFLLDVAPAGGEQWEVSNSGHGSTPYHYTGKSWEDIAHAHAYFIAGLHAIKEGRNPANLFLQPFTAPTPGHASFQTLSEESPGKSECVGSVQVEGRPL